jgi:hypothetical protein
MVDVQAELGRTGAIRELFGSRGLKEAANRIDQQVMPGLNKLVSMVAQSWLKSQATPTWRHFRYNLHLSEAFFKASTGEELQYLAYMRGLCREYSDLPRLARLVAEDPRSGGASKYKAEEASANDDLRMSWIKELLGLLRTSTEPGAQAACLHFAYHSLMAPKDSALANIVPLRDGCSPLLHCYLPYVKALERGLVSAVCQLSLQQEMLIAAHANLLLGAQPPNSRNRAIMSRRRTLLDAVEAGQMPLRMKVRGGIEGAVNASKRLHLPINIASQTFEKRYLAKTVKDAHVAYALTPPQVPPVRLRLKSARDDEEEDESVGPTSISMAWEPGKAGEVQLVAVGQSITQPNDPIAGYKIHALLMDGPMKTKKDETADGDDTVSNFAQKQEQTEEQKDQEEGGRNFKWDHFCHDREWTPGTREAAAAAEAVGYEGGLRGWATRGESESGGNGWADLPDQLQETSRRAHPIASTQISLKQTDNSFEVSDDPTEVADGDYVMKINDEDVRHLCAADIRMKLKASLVPVKVSLYRDGARAGSLIEQKILGGYECEYTVSGLRPEKFYMFRLVAYNSVGESTPCYSTTLVKTAAGSSWWGEWGGWGGWGNERSQYSSGGTKTDDVKLPVQLFTYIRPVRPFDVTTVVSRGLEYDVTYGPGWTKGGTFGTGKVEPTKAPKSHPKVETFGTGKVKVTGGGRLTVTSVDHKSFELARNLFLKDLSGANESFDLNKAHLQSQGFGLLYEMVVGRVVVVLGDQSDDPQSQSSVDDLAQGWENALALFDVPMPKTTHSLSLSAGASNSNEWKVNKVTSTMLEGAGYGRDASERHTLNLIRNTLNDNRDTTDAQWWGDTRRPGWSATQAAGKQRMLHNPPEGKGWNEKGWAAFTKGSGAVEVVPSRPKYIAQDFSHYDAGKLQRDTERERHLRSTPIDTRDGWCAGAKQRSPWEYGSKVRNGLDSSGFVVIPRFNKQGQPAGSSCHDPRGKPSWKDFHLDQTSLYLAKLRVDAALLEQSAAGHTTPQPELYGLEISWLKVLLMVADKLIDPQSTSLGKLTKLRRLWRRLPPLPYTQVVEQMVCETKQASLHKLDPSKTEIDCTKGEGFTFCKRLTACVSEMLAELGGFSSSSCRPSSWEPFAHIASMRDSVLSETAASRIQHAWKLCNSPARPSVRSETKWVTIPALLTPPSSIELEGTMRTVEELGGSCSVSKWLTPDDILAFRTWPVAVPLEYEYEGLGVRKEWLSRKVSAPRFTELLKEQVEKILCPLRPGGDDDGGKERIDNMLTKLAEKANKIGRAAIDFTKRLHDDCKGSKEAGGLDKAIEDFLKNTRAKRRLTNDEQEAEAETMTRLGQEFQEVLRNGLASVAAKEEVAPPSGGPGKEEEEFLNRCWCVLDELRECLRQMKDGRDTGAAETMSEKRAIAGGMEEVLNIVNGDLSCQDCSKQAALQVLMQSFWMRPRIGFEELVEMFLLEDEDQRKIVARVNPDLAGNVSAIRRVNQLCGGTMLRCVRYAQLNRCIEAVDELKTHVRDMAELVLTRWARKRYSGNIDGIIERVPRAAARWKGLLKRGARELMELKNLQEELERRHESHASAHGNKRGLRQMVMVAMHLGGYEHQQASEWLGKPDGEWKAIIQAAYRGCAYQGHSLPRLELDQGKLDLEQMRQKSMQAVNAIKEENGKHVVLLNAIKNTAGALHMQIRTPRAQMTESFLKEKKWKPPGSGWPGVINLLQSNKEDQKFRFDPRVLTFEFITTFMMRPQQLELIGEFVQKASTRDSKGERKKPESFVEQMIMGGGKTSVISPMLALLLADGKRLVLQMVPRALLEHSMGEIRDVFNQIIRKTIVEFKFVRKGQGRHEEVMNKYAEQNSTLHRIRSTRGLVCTEPASIKCMMLEYVDLLQNMEMEQSKRPLLTLNKSSFNSNIVAAQRFANLVAEEQAELSSCTKINLTEMGAEADAIARLIRMFNHGVVLIGAFRGPLARAFFCSIDCFCACVIQTRLT